MDEVSALMSLRSSSVMDVRSSASALTNDILSINNDGYNSDDNFRMTRRHGVSSSKFMEVPGPVHKQVMHTSSTLGDSARIP